MAYTYDYPHPAVTVDVVIFTIDDDDFKVLLIQRGIEPFEGMWAIPGGFVGVDESLRRAAWRELKEETGVSAAFLEQLSAFGHPDRDPRERVITVAYFALAPAAHVNLKASTDASEVAWYPVENLPDIIDVASGDFATVVSGLVAHGDGPLEIALHAPDGSLVTRCNPALVVSLLR